MTFETRASDQWPDMPMEMRATREGLIVEGYAVPFDSPSVPLPGKRGPFRETMRSGAFNDALARKPDVLMKYQHNNLSLPTGRTTAGTLQLGTDTRGLTYRNALPDNELGRPIYDAIERRDITGVSISFRVVGAKNEKWSEDGSSREVFVAALGSEISYVDHPAYEATTATALRSLAEAAGVDGDELVRVFEELTKPDGRLTGPDRDLLMEAINKRTDAPLVGPNLASARERFARLAKIA